MALENIWQIALAAGIFILVLIAAIWAMRRAGSAIRGKRGSRLAVAETRAVDKNRHLVLVQCDDEEHLLLIGGPQDIVVKANVGTDFFEPVDERPSFAPAPMQPAARAPAFDAPQERREPGAPRTATENRSTNFSAESGTGRPTRFARPQPPGTRERDSAGPAIPTPPSERR